MYQRLTRVFTNKMPCLRPASTRYYRDSGKKPYVLKNGLGQPAILAKKTIEYYRREEGWNIQTVNVGAVINRTRFVERPIGIFDDRHHP